MTNPQVQRRPLDRGDLERMALPEAFWRVKIDGLPSVASTLVLNYLARFEQLRPNGMGLALAGPPGVGKTSLASIIARELRIRGFSVFFTTTWDLREAIRSRAVFDAEQPVVERVRTVDVLILDNLRAEDATDHFLGRRVLEENLVARANSARPTILTTPLVFGELDDPKGPWRGLLQASRLTYANVQGPDLREKLLRTTKDLLQTPVTNPMPRGTK